MEYIAHYPSPLGDITLAGTKEAVTGLWFDGQKYFKASLSKTHTEQTLPVLEQTKRWLDCYFSGREPNFMPPLEPKGTPFQREVWAILRRIPYGQTVTYKAIAEQIAAGRGLSSMSSQAIGGAVGRNPMCWEAQAV